MTSTEITSFLDAPLKKVLTSGQLDAILALRVAYPESSLYDILNQLLRQGIEVYVSSEIKCELYKYLHSSINPELPW